MATCDVRIVRRGNIKCAVVPGYVFLNVGDTVVFHAVGSNVVVLVPDNIFTDGEQVFPISPGTPVSKVIETGTQGIHPYAVYCADHMDFAEGKSPPTMIVL